MAQECSHAAHAHKSMPALVLLEQRVGNAMPAALALAALPVPEVQGPTAETPRPTWQAHCVAATLTKMIKEHIPPDQMRVSGEVISLIVDCCSGAPVPAPLVHAHTHTYARPAQRLRPSLATHCSAASAVPWRRAEFVKRVYTQANDICTGDKKATIVADHVLRALERLALHDWLPNLEAALADFKDSTKSAPPFHSLAPLCRSQCTQAPPCAASECRALC